MAPPDKYLLPPASELQSLSTETIKAIAALADADSRRANGYAIVGMFCGTVSFLGCLGSYVYLVMQHHDTAAGVVLGATVLAVIGRMIHGR
jgi:hypothetical protein